VRFQQSAFFARRGPPARNQELWIFLPAIQIDGCFRLRLRLDRSLDRDLHVEGAASSTVLNESKIGLSVDEMVARWDAEHPDDPIED
jgi:hypothetical protein